MSDPLVVRESHGPVAVLVLNRPDRRNALGRELVAELGDALTALASDPLVRSVVLTGNGPTFCAGMDLKEAEAAGQAADSEKQAVADARGIADLIQQIHTLPKPVVAALNGDALAGGAGLASACDFVIAAEGARIGYPEVRRGLVAAVVMHDLVRQVGERRARALLLSGEPITAVEAERWGLVNRVVPPEVCRTEAIGVALSLTACAPLALSTIKRLIDETSGRPADLRGAAAVSAAVRVSDEALEGMRAFLEKRPPRWATEPTTTQPAPGSPSDRPPG
jgi:methylglutaconyl-CoA hydratase